MEEALTALAGSQLGTQLWMERVSMIDVTYDPDADAAYIRLAASADHGGVGRTIVTDVELDRAAINMDFGADGLLLGIEVLGASRVLAKETVGKRLP